MQNYQLVLASTSPFRQQILAKLKLPFVTAKPDCDETPLIGETPEHLVMRLAENKARSCFLADPSLVIGSDQVCVIDDQIIGKPLTTEKAVEQLLRQSGQAITFYTGLALFNNQTQQTQCFAIPLRYIFEPYPRVWLDVMSRLSNHCTVQVALKVRD